jgi:small subunit ribosomal protein S17
MPRKILEGRVVNSSNTKTVSVSVITRTSSNNLYGKTISTSKKYAAHDPGDRYKVGDRVRIRETRPISKTKRWEVLYSDPVTETL